MLIICEYYREMGGISSLCHILCPYYYNKRNALHEKNNLPLNYYYLF